MNLKITLIALISLVSASLFAAEAPPKAQSPSYISQLPAELRGELRHYALHGTGYPDALALANTIITMQNNITPEKLLETLEALPTVIALELAQYLKNLPALNNPAVAAWVANAPTQLINGQALFDAAARGQVKRVKNLLANKYIDVNWRNPAQSSQLYSLTPLLRVVSLLLPPHIVVEIVDMLLKAGANPDLASQTKPREGNKDNWTPLMAMASKGNEQAVSMLLKANANINAQDVYGDSALIEAATKGRTQIVQMLLEAGANPNLANSKGETAHTVAKTSEIKQLLEAAAAKRK